MLAQHQGPLTYLQVFSENVAGLALYESLGFREAYRYCHCVLPGPGPAAGISPDPGEGDGAGGAAAASRRRLLTSLRVGRPVVLGYGRGL